MTEVRRTYRTPATREAAPSPVAPSREPARETAPEQKKGTFVTITGLFKAKSGKADTVFVTEAIVEALQQIQPGDTLGVSPNKTTGRPSLGDIQQAG
jgi:hypothetical protein